MKKLFSSCYAAPFFAIVIISILTVFYREEKRFYLEGGLIEYQKWFPRFYWVFWLLVKYFFPAAAGIWLSLVLYNVRGTTITFSVLAGIVLAFCVLFVAIIFTRFEVYVFAAGVVLLLQIYFFIPTRIFYYVLHWSEKIVHSPLLEGVGFFILYLVLCLVLPKFHPFSKYTMFDSFPSSTEVFYAATPDTIIIPLANYAEIDANNIYEYYQAWVKSETGYQNDTTDALMKVAGKALWQMVVDNLKASVPTDSLSIFSITFSLEGDSVKAQRKLLYQDRLPNNF